MRRQGIHESAMSARKPRRFRISQRTGQTSEVFRQVSIAPLVIFRILFGGMMFLSILRFAYKGWIDELYIQPQFFFTYYGFEWVQPLGAQGMYAIFALMAMAALGIMLGYRYRLSAILFFLSFTYVELLDKSNYLNHYYFVSLVSFLMIWLPAHRDFSLDVRRIPALRRSTVAAWTIRIIQFQLAVVYVYAGIAKLNPDWLFHAMPLKLWLPAQGHLPLIGYWLQQEWVAYAFCWMGAFYDLFIVFFLLYRKTRPWAYVAVLAFHGMTALLFQIGMFPYIMILATLIFFPASFHQLLIDRWRAGMRSLSSGSNPDFSSQSTSPLSSPFKAYITPLLTLYILIQLLLPFRFALYPNTLFWTEQGYRFSWRVMLMEKAGYAMFNVHDPVSGKMEQVRNYEYLTPNQEKMMSTQPDMILQFAHFLEKIYKNKGFVEPAITVESYVSLNGRRSRLLLDPTKNLAAVEEGFSHKDWILPFEE